MSEMNEPLQKTVESVAPTETPKNENSPPPPMQPSVRSDVIPTMPDEENAKKSKHHTPLWEKLAVLVALGLLLVNSWQARITQKAVDAANRSADAANKTFGEIQKQTTLMHQQVVGIQEAVVRVDQPSWDESKRQLTIYVSNNGLVNATVTTFSAKVARKTLPTQRPIGDPIRIDFSNQVIPKGNPYRRILAITWPMPEIDVKFWPGKEFTTFEGTFAYNNGFNEPRTDSFCLFWLPPWKLEGIKQGWGGGGWSSPAEHCDVVRAINNVLTLKKQVEEEKKQH